MESLDEGTAYRTTREDDLFGDRKRYRPIAPPEDFSDEEMARDWTLSDSDKQEINKYRKSSRPFVAIQLCTVRLYGRFLHEVNDLSPRIVNYVNGHEKKHREFRKRQKKAVDTILDIAPSLLEWPEEEPLYAKDLWERFDREQLREAVKDPVLRQTGFTGSNTPLSPPSRGDSGGCSQRNKADQALVVFKRLEERGYGDLLLARYPGMRKYFAELVHLPFGTKVISCSPREALYVLDGLLENNTILKIPNIFFAISPIGSSEGQCRSSSTKANTGTNCPDGFLSRTRASSVREDYEEIMNKASCLSLVSNIILYWNTLKINGIVESLRRRGECVDDAVLAHISLLPYKYVLPNGTCFIEGTEGEAGSDAV